MTPEQLADMTTRLEYLEGVVNRFMLQDRLYAEKNLQLADGRNVILGGKTGTTVGQSTSKLSFFGVTPVAKQAAVNTVPAPGATYSQTDAQNAANSINSLITTLKNLGLMS